MKSTAVLTAVLLFFGIMDMSRDSIVWGSVCLWCSGSAFTLWLTELKMARRENRA